MFSAPKRTRSLIVAALAACVAIALTVPMVAAGWVGDFFDGSASGQAVYEEMSIHPQAVRVGTRTYVVYQGAAMDPYIVSFADGSTRVDGPYKIGENPCIGGVNHDDPSDSHGAPSIVYDDFTKQLHVFFGAHLTGLQYSRCSVADISKWDAQKTIASPVTYPQPSIDSTGTLHVFLRWDRQSGDPFPNGSWVEITSADHGNTWSAPQIVIRADSAFRWYIHFQAGKNDTVHAAIVGDVFTSSNPFIRENVYYMKRDAEGVWRDAKGDSVAASATLGVERSDLESDTLVTSVCTNTIDYQNQATVAENASGEAGLLYLSGNGYGSDKYEWRFASFSGSEWTSTTVATTDHFMDSSALEYRPDGSLEAFLTMEGTKGAGSSSDKYVDRGGDIVQWTSTDNGVTWKRGVTVRQSNLDQGVVYNDPQFIVNHDGGPRMLFGEWDNDAGNYIHKVYLWGDTGLVGKEFFPSPTRLGGANRYSTAVAISQQGFPTGSNYVIVASGEVYADALAGVPLAEAYKAPLLLVSKNAVPAEVTAEVKRLAAENVIVLGGENTITKATAAALKAGKVTSVTRISGDNRYAVAQNIAIKLKAKRGKSALAFVVSGENFPDALSVSAVAAAKGAPILLTRANGLPLETSAALKTCGTTQAIVVGGTTSVSDAVVAALPNATRIGGATRYDAAANVALLGLQGGAGVPASLRTDRVVVASGEVFADALAGGALAARMRCPIMLTSGSKLSASTAGVLDARARRVLDYYFLGGERTLTPAVATSVTDVLRGHQAE